MLNFVFQGQELEFNNEGMGKGRRRLEVTGVKVGFWVLVGVEVLYPRYSQDNKNCNCKK